MRIEINLLSGQKKKKKSGGGFELPDISEFLSAVKDPLLAATVGAWAIAALFIGSVFVTMTSRMASLEAQAESVRAEAQRYNDLLDQQRRAMDLRDSLLAELDAIRKIDGDRYVWPHILQEVTRSIPDYTWLVGVENVAGAAAIGDTGAAPPVRVRVAGRTSEIAAYTRFLRQLANSPWISLVEDGPAQRVSEDGRNLTSFEMTATFRRADSAFMLTVPVTESSR